MNQKIYIKGLSCKACQNKAFQKLSSINNMEDIDINLQSGEVKFSLPRKINIEKLNQLFADTTYEVLDQPIQIKKTYYIDGIYCNDCTQIITQKISAIEGVQDINIDVSNKEVKVIYFGSKIPFHRLKKSLENTNYTIHTSKDELNKKYPESESSKGNGIFYCPMYCEGEKVYVSNSACPVCGMDLVREISSASSIHEAIRQEDKEYSQLKKNFWIALACTIPLFILTMSPMFFTDMNFFKQNKNLANWLQLILSIPVYFYCASFIFRRAIKSLTNLQFNMYTLIGLGSGIAWMYSMVVLLFGDYLPSELKNQDGGIYLYFEAGTMILTLALLGQLLEFRANIKTKDSIKTLLNLTPNKAIRIDQGETEQEIHVNQLQVGDLIKVKAGVKVPVDGIIQKGQSTFNESMLTGESKPIFKKQKDKVIGGSLNGNHTVIVKALRVGEDTILAQIIELVNKASKSKAPIQKLVDKIARYFVPIVVLISFITFGCWMFFGPSPPFIFALINAVAVLIIACPCVLGLATPMSVMVGVGRGAQHGILIKEAKVIEEIQRVDTIVLDKTGTLTEGKPKWVNTILTDSDISHEEIKKIAIALNRNSNHPFAKAMVEYGKQHSIYIPYIVMSSQELPGKGIQGKVNGNDICIGNQQLMDHFQIPIHTSLAETIVEHHIKGQSISFIAQNGIIIGYLVFEDKIKESSKKAINNLKAKNLDVIIISGDVLDVTRVVAEELGIQKYFGNTLPEGKLEIIRELQASGRIVAMVGDGINDAPALTLSNVGIAMETGIDIALESAQVTLINGDIQNLPKVFDLSHKIMQNIKQNLWFAFGYNILGIPVAAGILYPIFGILLSPMLAALAMSFSSVSVISNALRLKNMKL